MNSKQLLFIAISLSGLFFSGCKNINTQPITINASNEKFIVITDLKDQLSHRYVGFTMFGNEYYDIDINWRLPDKILKEVKIFIKTESNLDVITEAVNKELYKCTFLGGCGPSDDFQVLMEKYKSQNFKYLLYITEGWAGNDAATMASGIGTSGSHQNYRASVVLNYRLYELEISENERYYSFHSYTDLGELKLLEDGSNTKDYRDIHNCLIKHNVALAISKIPFTPPISTKEHPEPKQLWQHNFGWDNSECSKSHPRFSEIAIHYKKIEEDRERAKAARERIR